MTLQLRFNAQKDLLEVGRKNFGSALVQPAKDFGSHVSRIWVQRKMPNKNFGRQLLYRGTSEDVASLLASLACQQSTLQQSEQGKRTLSSIRINVIELFYLRGLCRTKYANVGEGL